MGGGVGSVARYLVGQLLPTAPGGHFPWATFAVNIVGCLLIGLFATIALHSAMRAEVRSLLIAGLCGGLTTFSTFCREALDLFTAGAVGQAALYVAVSLAVGLGAVAAGYLIASRLYA